MRDRWKEVTAKKRELANGITKTLKDRKKEKMSYVEERGGW